MANATEDHMTRSNLTFSYDDFEKMLSDLSDEDFLSPGLPLVVRGVCAAAYVTIIVLALIGNTTVIVVIAINKKLRTVTHMYLMSLAASDLAIAGLNMPFQLLFYLENEWTCGEVLCKLSNYIQGVVVVASILTLSGIAIDR